MRSRAAIALVAALASLILPPAASAAVPPAPSQLQAWEGEGWRPEPRFHLRWQTPDTAGDELVAAWYAIRGPLGELIRQPRSTYPGASGADVEVPRLAGTYTAEVWLEDAWGHFGPPASTKLRFDAARPGFAGPVEEPGWIGRAELPHAIRVHHPGGPAPTSGIRGYAVSIDRSPDAAPCASAAICIESEVDLRDGVAGDTLVVPELPEGMSFVHTVAVSGAGVRSEAVGHAGLRVDRTDPVTRLEGIPHGWTNRTVLLRAVATDALSGMAEGQGGTPYTAIRVDGGPPAIVSGNSVGAAIQAEGIHRVAYYARDAAGNVDDGQSTNGWPNRAPGTAVVRIDRQPPAVSLVGSVGPRDPELIEARVADEL
jgi:hypothetical protein